MENEVKYSEEIEKVINRKDTSCAMYGTPECRFLNAENCAECAVGSMKKERQEEAKSALSRLMREVPQHELELLYTGNECLFCKGSRNKADRFGLLDLSKPDPEGDWTFAIGKRKIGVKAANMILPLQMSACPECARRHRAIAYIPGLVGVVIAALGLILTTGTGLYKILFEAASFLPALTMLGFVLLAIAARFGIRAAMKASYSKHTHLDVTEIPELKPFLERGFEEVAERKQGVSSVVFTKTFREHGVGSLITGEFGGEEPMLMGIWPAEEPARSDNENENADGRSAE